MLRKQKVRQKEGEGGRKEGCFVLEQRREKIVENDTWNGKKGRTESYGNIKISQGLLFFSFVILIIIIIIISVSSSSSSSSIGSSRRSAYSNYSRSSSRTCH